MPPNVSSEDQDHQHHHHEEHWGPPRCKYPSIRDGFRMTGDQWLVGRRVDDGAENLWRVGDNLYDLTNFVHSHPGGEEWLTLTKGLDITEMFYSHHITPTAELLLPKYFVRSASISRNSPYTFHEDGFYMKLRQKVRQILADTPKEVREAAKRRSKTYIDSVVVISLLSIWLAGVLNSYFLLTLAGLLFALIASMAHNFFHQKQNWRRYYFEISMMSSREWMISHVLSHHMFPNSLQDIEVTLFEPLLLFLPDPGKNWVQRFLSWMYSFFMYSTVAHMSMYKRLNDLRVSDAMCLLVPAVLLLSGQGLWQAWLMWTWVLLVSSLHFTFQGLTAGHHHPDVFHHGDTIRNDRDFGLMQLDTAGKGTGIRSDRWLFFALSYFGNHRMHHLFPSLDHAELPLVSPALDEMLKGYSVSVKPLSVLEMIKGNFMQLQRISFNPNPPGAEGL